MRLRKLLGVVLMFPLLFSGCADDDDVKTKIQTDNPVGLLAITVADGQDAQKPSYFWSYIPDSQDTTAQALTIARKDVAGTPVWKITSIDGQDSIDSGVPHGPPPPGSVQAVTGGDLELALLINVWYIITLEKVSPPLSSSIEFLILP